jgi:hypothetical protein
VTDQAVPKSHTFFGTLFRLPDSHTFWRNRARSGDDNQDVANATSEIQRFPTRTGSILLTVAQPIALHR